jgi:KTSC domain-containing protein
MPEKSWEEIWDESYTPREEPESQSSSEREESSFTDWRGVRSESGWVIAAAYDYANRELWVEFKGATCVYKVGPEYFEGITSASSAGSYVHENLYTTPYRLG